MTHTVKGKELFLDNAKLVFPVEIGQVVQFDNVYIILLSPNIPKEIDWENKGKKMWKEEWQKLEGGNVLAYDKVGRLMWRWNHKSSGLSKLMNHWIKLNKTYDNDKVIWISHVGCEYLVSLEDGKVLEKISTEYLK